MDKRQKSTLRSQHIKIADELILDEDFYAALRRDKIFTNGMLDLIKAEVKPRDRVYKMLELLEKRGPKAFENFVWILKENYEWLAEELEDQYAKRLQSYQQERGMQEQGHARYATNPKYFDQDEERFYNPENRAVSTPPHRRKARQVIPMQDSMSAGYNTKDCQQFFPKPGYTEDSIPQQYPIKRNESYQDMGLDDTDTGAVGVTMQLCDETDSRPQKKQYKDACMSPIGIIESQRSITNDCQSKALKCDEDEAQSVTESCDQGFDEIQSQTATVSTSNNDDVESTVTRTTEVNSVGVSDNVDGPEDVNVAVDDIDEDFPSSEAYYDCIRRGSSRFSHFGDAFHAELDIKDDENDISYEQSEAFQIQMDAMRKLYKKLVEVNFGNEDNEDTDDDNDITWDMLECETDRLIDRLENSDDMKMIRKCHSLFQEKERRQPLNTCIENLQADKKELESKLKDKQKEIDQMVFDLWKHQQDMSNLKKLQKRLSEQDIELNNYKTSLENLEKDAEIKLRQISEKDLRIETLEVRLRELQGDQHRRPGIQMRRGTTTQRRTSNAQGQSPRRAQPNNYGEPRILMQGGYGNSSQSPRNVSAAMRRAPNNRR
ncbi:uncharacterized protein LOC132716407 [Ruditapes philippinarum]|uniref:uncharacterized protein LOC132716407 n=1 Tax=Ruditapes philippinarum TaxID=129788 RepID=UPI00295B0679|nr:uncharacterized protein LOC132716407 [Ruditapes philippinarum]XP_060555657.1 uncharacterized protein LOC132716407 [Ruditapes philippinarum]